MVRSRLSSLESSAESGFQRGNPATQPGFCVSRAQFVGQANGIRPGVRNVRDHRIRRKPRGQAAAPAGAQATRVPRVRLRGDRAARGRPARLRARGRQPAEPHRRRRPERVGLESRPRPHPLGHPRRGQRAERAPADRLPRRQGRDRAERDRRELPRAQSVAAAGRSRVPHRDRRRSRHAPRRAPLRRRSARGRARRVRRARGPLRVRRHPPRPPRHADRRAAPVPARGRRRRRRDVPRVRDDGIPEPDPTHPAGRGRRGRRDHARGRALLHARTARSSTRRSSRSSGTTSRPRRAATRPSC